MFDFGISDLVSSYQDFIADSSGEDSFALATEFSISFSGDGESQTYYFALLPAVDDGNETTAIPEIKPGILKKTNMQIKRFTIPGSSSIFQMVGVRETILQCVGLLIGEEGLNNDDLTSMSIYNPSSSPDAYSSALEFDNEVVQRGSVCKLNILSKLEGGDLNGSESINIQHNCFIQNYRYFVNRSDRVWFSLELVILDYSPGGNKFTKEMEQQQEADIEVSVDSSSSNNSNDSSDSNDGSDSSDNSGAEQNQPVENTGGDDDGGSGPRGSAL